MSTIAVNGRSRSLPRPARLRGGRSPRCRSLSGAGAVLELGGLRPRLAAARNPLRGRGPLLLLRHDEDPAAAGRDHLRRPHPSQLPLDRAHPRPARRQARRRRQRARGRARGRDPVLLLQRRASVHRLRRRRDPARGHAQLPDREPAGERGRGRVALRDVRRSRSPRSTSSSACCSRSSRASCSAGCGSSATSSR